MDPVLKAFLFTVGGIAIGATLNFFYGRLGKRRDNKTETEKQELAAAKLAVIERDKKLEEQTKRLDQMELKVALMEQAAIPINAAWQAMAIAGLRHHDEPELDAIMDKMTAGDELTADEVKRRNAALKIRENDPTVDEAERIKAKILPDIARLVELDKLEGLNDPMLETVLVSQPLTKEVHAPDGSSQREDVKGS